jgi:hypothetical protein
VATAHGFMEPQRNLAGVAFDNIAMDIFPLPPKSEYDACLTIVDTFTKAVILRPTKTSADTEDIANLLFNSVLCKGFLPSTVISDQDPKYTSDLWTKVMAKLGTKIQLTTPYHQQADPAERTIQTVQTVLRCYNETDWVSRIPYVELVLNDSKHESTGYSPNELLYVSRSSPIIDAMSEQYEHDDFPEVLAQAKQKVREAMDNIRIAQGKQKMQHDLRHRTPEDIIVGDLAYLLLDKHPVRGIKKNKLTWPKWGPFKVLAVTDTSVDLDFPPNARIKQTISRQHVERLPPDDFDDAPPEPEHIDEEEAWEVESIIGQHLYGRAKQQQFQIKWRNWPINQSTWEPEDRLRADMDEDTLDVMIRDYWESTSNTTPRARRSLREAGSSANAMQAVEASARPEVSGGTEDHPRGRPILYLSRTLPSYEKNYTILELELRAVVWSILKLQRYLDGVPFTVVTDHQPILQVVSSNSKTLTSPRVERWRMLLQPYMGQMTFVHKAKKKHLNVDALSRLAREDAKQGDTRIGNEGSSGRRSDTGAFQAEGMRRRRRM